MNAQDAPPRLSLADLIRSDLARFTGTYALRGQPHASTRVIIESLLFKAGFQAVLLYRLSHWLFRRRWIYPAWFVARLNVTLTGAEIEFNASIGPGLMIAHPVGIVVGRGTVIGRNATLFQGTTLAVRSWDPDEIRRFPRLGDNCFLFARSAVFGGVTVGDNCVVAAHSVVLTDVPDGHLAVGAPARLYPDRGHAAVQAWLFAGTGPR